MGISTRQPNVSQSAVALHSSEIKRCWAQLSLDWLNFWMVSKYLDLAMWKRFHSVNKLKINPDRASWSIKPISCFLPPANVACNINSNWLCSKTRHTREKRPQQLRLRTAKLHLSIHKYILKKGFSDIVTTPAVHWPSYVWVLTLIRVFSLQQTALSWSHALSLPILPSRGIFVLSERVRYPNVHFHEGRAEMKWVHTWFLFWQPSTLHHLTWWL